MDRRTRICVWVIIGGLINFLLFGILYFVLGGDARNGFAGEVSMADAAHVDDLGEVRYFVRMRQDDPPTEVAWGWFLYSHIHGVSLWLTHAAVLLAMLTLAKDHIISVLNEGYGRFLIHAVVVVVVLMVTLLTIWWLLDFRHTRKHPVPVTWQNERISVEKMRYLAEKDPELQFLPGLKIRPAVEPPTSQPDAP